MRCGNCGREIPLSNSKCPHCGASAAQQEYFHPPIKKNTPQKEKPMVQTKLRQPRVAVADKIPPQKNPPVNRPVAKPRPPVKQVKIKQERTPRSKTLFIVLIIWGVIAISLYCTSFSFFSNEDRYLQTGENFVRAMILQDETTLSSLVHSSMRGNLHPMGYETVDSYEVHGTVAEDVNGEALQKELSERYGLQETVAAARWIFVEYTVERNGQVDHCSIEVLLANIGGDIYAVKTRNMQNTP